MSYKYNKTILVPELIFTVSNILSPEECGECISLSEKMGDEPVSIATSQDFEMRPDPRNSTRVVLDDEQRAANLWNRIAPYISPTFENWLAISLNERFRFYRYIPGQRLALHYDEYYQRDNGEKSIITLIVYLNEGFSGGDTCFHLPSPYSKTTIVPQTGMALCFLHRLLHESTPVISGRKYILRTDVMYSLAE